MALIAIVDYGMGNVRSVAQALMAVAPDVEVRISGDADVLLAAERIVLPGQGAMPDCMANLEASGLRAAVLECARTKPLLGVCVGEQMLCDFSDEGATDGLGLIPGRCVRFLAPDVSGNRLKVPHMGWNRVSQTTAHPLWAGIEDESYFYFVHSFYAVLEHPSDCAGTTDYGDPFTSAIARDNIFATQFHPEKSAAAGLQLYQNFVTWNP